MASDSDKTLTPPAAGAEGVLPSALHDVTLGQLAVSLARPRCPQFARHPGPLDPGRLLKSKDPKTGSSPRQVERPIGRGSFPTCAVAEAGRRQPRYYLVQSDVTSAEGKTPCLSALRQIAIAIGQLYRCQVP